MIYSSSSAVFIIFLNNFSISMLSIFGNAKVFYSKLLVGGFCYKIEEFRMEINSNEIVHSDVVFNEI